MTKRTKKDELISKTGEIADAFSVFIAAGGNVAVWVLFVCMIANIIDAAVNFPTVVSVAIMVIQAVVLDIAGFGLQTIAKRLLKVNDMEVQEAARKGKSFAGWLIFVMIVTMILITSKTLAPVVVPLFTQNSHLVSTIQNNIDIIDKVLVLARIGFTVAYVHTIHNLREIDADIQQDEELQVQANDQRILDVDKKVGALNTTIQRLENVIKASEQQYTDVTKNVDKLASDVHNLYTQMDEVCTGQEDLCTQIADLYTKTCTPVASSVDTSVYTARLSQIESRLNKLETSFKNLNISFTEVHNNVLNLTQNVHAPEPYVPADRPRNNVVNVTEEPVGLPQIAAAPVPQTAVIPVLDVPGIAPEKVTEIIAAYIAGTQWRDIRGNYSRTIKPVRDAYEAYLAAQESETVHA